MINGPAVDVSVCPLCGRPNHCRAQAITPCNSESCWCFDTAVPAELLEKIPRDQRNQSCICEACVKRFVQEVS